MDADYKDLLIQPLLGNIYYGIFTIFLVTSSLQKLELPT